MDVSPTSRGKRGPNPPLRFDRDPLDEDEVDDARLSISTRQLARVAVVAVETGARFQRDLSPMDPVTWLLSPCREFGGVSILEASLSRDHCLDLVVLNGLSAVLPGEGNGQNPRPRARARRRVG